MKIIPVILSGGSGTRLWPLSREKYPKQYLSLTEGGTLLQETILRLKSLENIEEPIIVCNEQHRFVVAEQCQQIDIANPVILLEPVSRNTAPAIAAAAFYVAESSEKSVLLVLSADHIIQDVEKFHKSIGIAINSAELGKLVTFGVLPTGPRTGYGYIRYSMADPCDAKAVDSFVEKPSLERAKSFINQQNYLWNSGMFAFEVDSFIQELSLHSPAIMTSAKSSVQKSITDLDFIRLDKAAFSSSPNKSIDYALMERSSNVVVVLLDAGWSDIGTWSALYDIGSKDNENNVVQGNVVTIDTDGSYINASSQLVVTLGVSDLVIVDTPDATLVSTKDRSQDIKLALNELRKHEKVERYIHRKTFRPWGWYDVIANGKGFQVKQIHINPGKKLSLQSHKYRAEHWIIVHGSAMVTCGSEKFILKVNESTYIPIGERHSLENIDECIDLELIEVQSGSYLGEDDIMRYEDAYGRV